MTTSSLALLAPILEKDRLADRSYTVIREAILADQITPGTALSVPELARRLGVSRSPVREAVQRLIHDGLASHERHRGAVVNEPRIDSMLDLFVVREPLEGLAASLATRTAATDDVGRLRALMAEHEALRHDPGALDQFIELDKQFHREIRTIAHNQHLTQVLESISTLSHSASRTLWDTPTAATLAFKEHAKIVDAIEAGDPSLAEAAACEHISRLRVRLRRAFSDPSESDPPAQLHG